MNTTIAQQIANEGGVEAYPHAQQHKSLLRFLTCGSVDDGKSTLIGRLLHDTRQIYEDQLSSLHNDSKRHGTQGEKLDLALLVDGLQAERARAGHHHRRGLSLLLDRKAQIYHRRHPGARAVHAQYGHWGVHLRPGDLADRCAQGRARPDPPSQLHLDAAGH